MERGTRSPGQHVQGCSAMTTASLPARLAVVVASLSLACGTSAASHPRLATQTQPPQLTASSPSNGADLRTWPGQATLTFNQVVTCESVTLSGPQGSVDTGSISSTGATCLVTMPARQPSGRYVMTYTAQSGPETTTGSIAFTVTTNQDSLGAPSETGTGNNGLIGVIVGVSLLGGALLFAFITRNRVVTKRRSSTGKNPDHL